MEEPLDFYLDFSLPSDPKKVIVGYAFEWMDSLLKIDKPHSQMYVILKWDPPIFGWHKLNVDGSRKMVSRNNGVGEILRDHNGDCLGGFSINLGQ